VVYGLLIVLIAVFQPTGIMGWLGGWSRRAPAKEEA
jgi:hypothetical protein